MLAIPRHLLLSLIGFLTLGLCPARADDADVVKEKLFQAKKEYDTALQKFKKSVTDLLDKREDDARKGGKFQLLDQVKDERAVFEKAGEAPSMLPSAIREPIVAARTKLDTAYKNAVKEYLRLKLDELALSTEKERQELLIAAAFLQGKRTYVATIKPFDIRVWKGDFPFGNDESKYKMNGEAIPHSVFIIPDEKGESSISYTLAGKMVAFRTSIGIPKYLDRQENPWSPVTFEVLGDNKSLWKSEPVKTFDSFQTCKVCVEKVKIFTLRIHCQASHIWAHTVWFGPIVAE
jgi:hypothetical protein